MHKRRASIWVLAFFVYGCVNPPMTWKSPGGTGTAAARARASSPVCPRPHLRPQQRGGVHAPARLARPAEPREVVGKAPGGHAPEAGEERLERGVQGVDVVERGARRASATPILPRQAATAIASPLALTMVSTLTLSELTPAAAPSPPRRRAGRGMENPPASSGCPKASRARASRRPPPGSPGPPRRPAASTPSPRRGGGASRSWS